MLRLLQGHRTAELRSLAYHRRVAEKRQLLDGPLEALLEFLQSDSQGARDLRQASPFAGALDARERWQLWREAAQPDADGTA